MAYSGGKPRILVADDIEINRFILEEMLSDLYDVELAENGDEAISKMIHAVEKPKLLLLDVMMPGMNGLQVIEFMKSNAALCKIPVILITAADAEKQGLSAGAIDYISKPFDPDIVRLRVSNQFELAMYRENLEGLVNEKANELLDTRQRFLDTMANLIEYRSLEASDHVIRTRLLVDLLLCIMSENDVYTSQLSKINRDAFLRAVPLHDIGKIGVPDNILLKPGKLTPSEFEIMKMHSTIGADAIKSLIVHNGDEYLTYAHYICRHHHERWDGAGYPDGLAGDAIPLVARMAAVTDVYDALVSERCYKAALSHEKAISIIQSSAGTQFDPHIVHVMCLSHQRFQNLRYE